MRLQEILENQQLDEIQRLTKLDYEGGKDSLNDYQSSKQIHKLPGGGDLLYSTDGGNFGGIDIKLWDQNGVDYIKKKTQPADPRPTRTQGERDLPYANRLEMWKLSQRERGLPGQLIGKLLLSSAAHFPLKNAMQVDTITVDEDYRGKGLAKALYGILLTLMKRPLLAGLSQTPGGRRNWLSLSQIPGVEMKGYVTLLDFELKGKQIDTIMGQLGGQYIGARFRKHYFAFDVMPATGELAPAVKTSLSKVYGSYDTGLYAVWTGK